MQRKVLVATVAAAPLLAMGFAASAETSVSTARTTPIATSTATGAAADDIKITTDGSIKPTTAGAIVTIDSNNKVTNQGTLSTNGVNDGVGVLIIGGRTGALSNTGTISLVEDYTATDSDSDGDLDGPFAQGANRFGVRLTNAGTFTGDIENASGGTITIEGNNSAGMLLEGPVVGNITNLGAISVVGDNAYGVRIAAPVTGKVTLGGSTAVQGSGAVAQAIDSNVTGALVLQGSVSATGYRYTTRPTTVDALNKLDADDLLQGGPAVRVAGDVTGGVLLQGGNYSTKVGTDGTTVTTTVTSSTTGTSSISVSGGSPALLIGSANQNVTLGAVGTGDNAYGLVAKGSISAAGVYNKVAATGVSIGAGGGRTTTITGGVRNDGQIAATSYEADSTGLILNSGATANEILNRGAIASSSSSYAGSGVTAAARGVVLGAGSSTTSLRNTGSVTAVRVGETGDAVAILDQAGTLKTITNTGAIRATVSAPTFKADGTAATVTAAGQAIALDLRANNSGVTYTQSGPVDFTSTSTFPSTDTTTSTDATTTTAAPSTVGDVLFGGGDDTLNLWSGTLLGNMAFGAGQDRLSIDGGAVALGRLTDSDGRLDVAVTNGSLGIVNTDTINVSSLTLGSKAKLLFSADAAAGTNTKLVVSGATNIASGAELGIRLANLVKQPTTFTVIQGGNINVGTIGGGLLAESPYLYVATSRADANNVYIDVRRRSAAEIGFNKAETSAYDAVFAALGTDSTLAGQFLGQSTRDGFRDLYDQMLPDQGEGLFSALQSVNQQISAATMFRPDPGDRYGPDSVWVQEINTLVRRDTDQTLGSDTQAYGFVAGYEAMGDAGGAGPDPGLCQPGGARHCRQGRRADHRLVRPDRRLLASLRRRLALQHRRRRRLRLLQGRSSLHRSRQQRRRHRRPRFEEHRRLEGPDRQRLRGRRLRAEVRPLLRPSRGPGGLCLAAGRQARRERRRGRLRPDRRQAQLQQPLGGIGRRVRRRLRQERLVASGSAGRLSPDPGRLGRRHGRPFQGRQPVHPGRAGRQGRRPDRRLRPARRHPDVLPGPGRRRRSHQEAEALQPAPRGPGDVLSRPKGDFSHL